MKTSAYIGPGALRVWSVRFCVALAILLPGSVGAVSAQAQTLQGVWAQTITPHHCETNQPFPSFRALLTFHRDGTVTESVGAPTFAAGQRSIGHGLWAHDGGLTYSERTVAMILFTGGTGSYQEGWQLTTRTITMTDANHYTSSGAAQFYDVNRQLYRTGCATSVGERLQ